VHGQDPDPVTTTRVLSGVDARIDLALQNAASYQDVHHAQEGMSHKQDIYDIKQEAAGIAKEVVKGTTKDVVNKLPGGEIIHGVLGKLRDDGYDEMIEKWNPKPSPIVEQFPSSYVVKSTADLDFSNRIRAATDAAGNQISTELRDWYDVNYGGGYNDMIGDFLAHNPAEIDQFVSGGVKITGEGK
jgi:hypothetical protein